jgi:uncharacterized membrane protein SpoIIM required for sporulation
MIQKARKYSEYMIVALIMLSVSAGGIYFNFVTLYGLVLPDSEVSDLYKDEWRSFSPEVLLSVTEQFDNYHTLMEFGDVSSSG